MRRLLRVFISLLLIELVLIPQVKEEHRASVINYQHRLHGEYIRYVTGCIRSKVTPKSYVQWLYWQRQISPPPAVKKEQAQKEATKKGTNVQGNSRGKGSSSK